MIDVENAWEILHFVQNDGILKDWIPRSALNDREKTAERVFERVLGVFFEIILTNKKMSKIFFKFVVLKITFILRNK
jgi:hypothetical protein